MAAANYIKLKRGKYHFQRRIPKDVRGHRLFAGKPEVIELSLGTSDPLLARKLAADKAIEFENMLREARGQHPYSASSGSTSSTPSDAMIEPRKEQFDDGWMDWAASEHFGLLISQVKSAYEYAGQGEPDSQERLEDVEAFELASLNGRKEGLKKQNIQIVRKTALSLLDYDGLLDTPLQKDRLGRLRRHPIEDTPEFKQFCRKLIRAELEAIDYIDALYDTGIPDDALAKKHAEIAKKNSAPGEYNIAAVGEALIASTPRISEEWAQRVRRIAAIVVELGVPSDIREINKGHVRKAFDQLAHCPSNSTQKFPGKSISELVEIGRAGSVDLLSPNTLKDGYLAPLKRIFSFADERDMIQSNPAAGVRIKGARKDKRGVGFNPDELNKLFQLPYFERCASDADLLTPGNHIIDDHRFWAPVLALFTGARTAEIAQLLLSEVMVNVEHPYFVIQETDDRELKTKAATRQLPIHPMLMDFGFADYVSRQTATGAKRLFPLWLAPKGKKFADSSSQRFFRRNIVPRISARQNPGPTFHSFRHTLKTELGRVGVQPHHQDKILGHEHHGISLTYMGAFDLPTLSKSMQMVRYESINFEPLLKRAELLANAKKK